MNVKDVIMSRKSLRDFSRQNIDKKIISEMISAAGRAPSFQNKQCWRFVFIEDKEIINQLAYHSGLIGKANFFIKKAPLIVAACADPRRSGTLNGMDYFLVDTAIAFQQMMLLAHSYGIGSCWLAAFNEEKVKNILKIPDPIKVVALSPFGYSAEKEKLYTKALKVFAGSKNRLPAEKIACFDRWEL